MTIVASTSNGSNLTVETDTSIADKPVVTVTVQSERLVLYPDEALRLAVALIEAAGRAEKPETGDWP